MISDLYPIIPAPSPTDQIFQIAIIHPNVGEYTEQKCFYSAPSTRNPEIYPCTSQSNANGHGSIQ